MRTRSRSRVPPVGRAPGGADDDPCNAGDGSASAASRRGRAAMSCVKLGEASRGRQRLVGAALAPGTAATLEALQSKRPATAQRPLPPSVLDFRPQRPLDLDRAAFVACLKSSPRGSAPGPGGGTFEHLRVLLDDEEGLDALFDAAEGMARADMPQEVAEAYMMARMTALP